MDLSGPTWNAVEWVNAALAGGPDDVSLDEKGSSLVLQLQLRQLGEPTLWVVPSLSLTSLFSPFRSLGSVGRRYLSFLSFLLLLFLFLPLSLSLFSQLVSMQLELSPRSFASLSVFGASRMSSDVSFKESK